jgi:hypothetical protein
MRVAAGGTLIRRYALALPPAGAGNAAAVTATAVPPLSGGPGNHDSEATHPLIIGGAVSRPRRGPVIGQSGSLSLAVDLVSTTCMTKRGSPANPVVDAVTFRCPSRVSRGFRAARHLIHLNALHKN